MAYSTFVASSNTSTNGTALGSDASRDVVVFSITIGTPVSAGSVWLYNITNPLNASTANIGWKVTLPTFSTTNINPGAYQFNFPNGLPLNQGGNIIIDQTMNVTVTWGYLDETN